MDESLASDPVDTTESSPRRLTQYELTWLEHDQLVDRILHFLHSEAFTPDLIVAIARGGLTTAVMLSHKIGCRNFGVLAIQRSASDEPLDIGQTDVVVQGALFPPGDFKSILVVDDIIALGLTIKIATQTIVERFPNSDIKLVSLFSDARFSESELRQDFAHFAAAKMVTDDWMVFPWESRNQLLLSE
jgi:hypoxanthine phosphoribosyltransferase